MKYTEYVQVQYKHTYHMYVLYMLSVYVAYAIFAFVSPLSIEPISNGNIKANSKQQIGK